MEELREKIINAINESKLPAECVYYLVKDVYREISDVYLSQRVAAQSAVNDKKEEEKGE